LRRRCTKVGGVGANPFDDEPEQKTGLKRDQRESSEDRVPSAAYNEPFNGFTFTKFDGTTITV
jgi:hypothetical protein